MHSKLRAGIGSASVFILIICSVALILPDLSLLYYINTFGVNVIFWDEWAAVPLAEKATNGTLSFSDLFAQQNEHRVLFPRVASLAIGAPTGFNTVAEMFFGWVLASVMGLLIFCIYLKKSSCGKDPKRLLLFLPVSLLLYSFRGTEIILWGFPSLHYFLMLFGVVVTLILLDVSKKIDVWFVLSFLSAILASFSFLFGLLVWPVGLLQVFSSSKRERDLRKPTLWCFVSVLVFFPISTNMSSPVIIPPFTLFCQTL